jgi:hypothetical protein
MNGRGRYPGVDDEGDDVPLQLGNHMIAAVLGSSAAFAAQSNALIDQYNKANAVDVSSNQLHPPPRAGRQRWIASSLAQ